MKLIFIGLLIVILLAFPETVLADVAPPYFPPGSNPQPGTESTEVRMEKETVLIEVQNDITPDSLGKAQVNANFTMHNLGSLDESMAVRFPISEENGRGGYPEIANLVIKVDRKQISYRRVKYPDTRNQDTLIPWAEFDMTFPAGKDTAIQVSYTLQGTGYPPYTAFYYILESGAGWKDTIGSADITLRLPYPANPQNVVLDYEIGWATTTPGATFQGNEAHWHFENFEPGPDGLVQNMEFALVSSAAWHSVLTERENVTRNPRDGEAWGRLAKAYKQIFLMSKGYRTDAGGEHLYQQSIDAYNKCLSLKPDDAQWHAGFADLLVGRSYWEGGWRNPTAATFQGLYEIRTALQLAPRDPRVQDIAANIQNMFPDAVSQTSSGYDFPWLTQTPTPIPPTPTIVPVFDPAAISGVYQSDMLTLSSHKKAQLIVTINPDHLAGLETRYENDPPLITTGSWMDNGDGTLKLTVTDPIRKEIEFVFKFDHDRLLAIQYSGLYGDAGISMVKQVSATPLPSETSTPEPAATLTAPTPSPSFTPSPTPFPTLPPNPASPICGSTALIPMLVIYWGLTARVRRFRNRSMK